MRRIEKPKLKVVEHEDGKLFQCAFNEEIEKLAKYNPEYVFKDFPHKHCAYITWIEHETILETVEDEFIMKGQKRHCNDCPYFEASKDGRIITGYCCIQDRDVRKDKPACELHYKRLKEGVI